MKRSLGLFVVTSLVLFSTAPVALAQEAAAPPTLWSFLGIPQGFNKAHAQLFNRRGNLPGLEKKPPLKAIADPANLKSDVPAIKAAAEIKQAEDMKAQKIKAIKYLAKIGCGCYDKDEKVTKALMAAMEDCTEEVRLEAVKAVTEAACSEACQQCKQRSCCNENIVGLLSKIANELDDQGCWVEPSERVRQAAAEALRACCVGQGPPPEAPPPIETPEPAPEIERGAKPPAAKPGVEDAAPQPPSGERKPGTEKPAASNAAGLQPLPGGAQLVSSRRRYNQIERIETAASPSPPTEPIEPPAPYPIARLAPVHERVEGTVASVNLSAGIVELHLHAGKTLPPGAAVKVYHNYLFGKSVASVLEVIDSRPGSASARPTGSNRDPKIAQGDEIVAWN